METRRSQKGDKVTEIGGGETQGEGERQEEIKKGETQTQRKRERRGGEA